MIEVISTYAIYIILNTTNVLFLNIPLRGISMLSETVVLGTSSLLLSVNLIRLASSVEQSSTSDVLFSEEMSLLSSLIGPHQSFT